MLGIRDVLVREYVLRGRLRERHAGLRMRVLPIFEGKGLGLWHEGVVGGDHKGLWSTEVADRNSLWQPAGDRSLQVSVQKCFDFVRRYDIL